MQKGKQPINNARWFVEKAAGNPVVRNLVMAVCAVILFAFAVNILLGVFTRHNAYQEVPDFSNMPLRDAEKAARKASLRIRVSDSLYVPVYEGGTILAQSPEPGAQVKSGRRIFVTVNSFSQKMVDVPYVTGVSLRQAKNNLEVAGLEIGKLIYMEDIATNYVLQTIYDGNIVTPGKKVHAEQGSGVILIIGMSTGDTVSTVPKVVGFPLREAKSRLWEAGLNVGNLQFDPDVTLLNRQESRVYSQTPEQGSRLNLGAPVSLSLTLDDKKVEKGSAASDRAAKKIISSQDTEESTE